MAFFDFLRRKKAVAPIHTPYVAPVVMPTPAQAIPAADALSPSAQVPPDSLPSELVSPAAATGQQQEVADASTQEEPEHDGPERRDRVRRNPRPGTRVLVIDDSPTIVALLKRMLKQNQLEVLEAFDAESGIEIARKEVPDMIFLDIVLPGMDGFRALRTLRRDPLTRHLPIIMISGNAQATEQFYVQRIGADDFMKKPFSRAEVFNRIEALLDEDCIPRHTAKPGTRAEAAEAAANG